jgi:Zn-dependent protease
MSSIFQLIFQLLVLMFSVIIHEIAHGSMALRLGDQTAKLSGRLTLNPLKHLDPIGSIVLPIFLVITHSPFVVGWAKPVPINPYNFRDQKWGEAKVSLAGPAANFLIAVFFGLLLRFLPLPQALVNPFAVIVIYNLVLAIFNLIPIPPLDGSWILLSLIPDRFLRFKYALKQYGLYILIFLIVFSGFSWVFGIARFIFWAITGHTI